MATTLFTDAYAKRRIKELEEQHYDITMQIAVRARYILDMQAKMAYDAGQLDSIEAQIKSMENVLDGKEAH